MMPMDGTEVMNWGISLSFGRASDRHCSHLTLEIGTIKRTTTQCSAVRGRSVLDEPTQPCIQFNSYAILSLFIFSLFHAGS